MARQYKHFMIPATSPEEAETELNQFLSSHRTTMVQRELVADGKDSFWSAVVEYDSGSGKGQSKSYGSKIDYREALSPDDFALFVKLRDWRKEKAVEANVKPYVVFTDAQLAKIIETRPKSKPALLAIEGIGDARMEKYGEDILKIITPNDEKRASPSIRDGQ